MNEMSLMGEVVEGKVIPRSYGEIAHLPGSKMIDKEDKLLGNQEIAYLTARRRDPKTDIVIITEKVDGCNVGVLKRNGKLYPIQKKGYDVRTNEYEWIRGFSYFVECNQNRFYTMLDEGERACGEWMIKSHTLSYDLPSEPFILFDIIKGEGKKTKRANYFELIKRSREYKFTNPGLVHIGESMPPEYAISILGGGYHGCLDIPEGVVYRYENLEKGFIFSGKFVNNQKLGKKEFFLGDDEYAYNKLKSKYSQYLYMKPKKPVEE